MTQFGYVPPVATSAQPESRGRAGRAGSGTASWRFACFGLFARVPGRAELTGWRCLRRRPAASTASPPSSYPAYLTTGHFVEATFENWESEFLQMAAFVLLTVFLVQRARPSRSRRARTVRRGPAPPSRRSRRALAGAARRRLADALREQPAHRVRRAVPRVDRSATRWAGAREYNAEQQAHGEQPVERVASSCGPASSGSSRSRTGRASSSPSASIVVLTIFLRQRGSPESKPVHAPVDETGD